MIGLDAAGKTSVLYKLKLNENIRTIPTIGFNMEEVEFGKLNFLIWDVGGQKRIRHLWHHYYTGADAVIFVIDSADNDRLACSDLSCDDCVKEELHAISQSDLLRNASLLFLANKQDLQGALSPSELRERLELDRLCRGHEWYVQPCCALTGDGLAPGFDWLARSLKHKPRSRR